MDLTLIHQYNIELFIIILNLLVLKKKFTLLNVVSMTARLRVVYWLNEWDVMKSLAKVVEILEKKFLMISYTHYY